MTRSERSIQYARMYDRVWEYIFCGSFGASEQLRDQMLIVLSDMKTLWNEMTPEEREILVKPFPEDELRIRKL